ncbi:MAG TPA: kelch repeat-containing protein, partial [Vicinamibacterales bacterium]|nr:kelch repeat-containing protein [Vicinamibacterales bacterium]
MKRVFASTVALLLVVGASSLFLTASSVTVPSGTWAPTGDLNDIRAGAAAVLLSDGVVMVTGGSAADGRVASAERYSVTGGTFIATESMHTARANHTATVLNDGRVLVVGGFGAGGAAVGTAEIYDPATNAWVSAGSLAHARAGHTATLLPDGRVLVAGGESGEGALATLEVYSPVFEQFSLVGTPMTAARMRHAAALAGEKVLITGGWDGAAALASVDVFDPANDSIAAGPAMLSARAEHTATTLLSGNVLVAGGMAADSGDLQSAEVFDAVASGFVPANAMVAARRNHIAILLPHNNSVLIAGGWSGGTASRTAELYRAWQDGGIFVSTGSSLAPRNWSAGSALSFAASATNRGGPADGLVLVAGGDGASSAELYGFATVKTDKDDYSPGMIVRVSGGGWQPNQPVTFYVRELPAEHFARLVTIDADGAGNISGAKLFDVEEHHLGVRFLLTAADGVSQAHMTFTDSKKLEIRGFGTGSGTVSATGDSITLNCTVAAATVSGTCQSGGFDNNATISVTASPSTGSAFGGWLVVSGNPSPNTCVGSTTNCSLNLNNTEVILRARFDLATAAASSVSNVSGLGTYGSTATLTATLSSGSPSIGVNGKTISFQRNGASVGTATTNASGVATLAGVSLTGINAGSYPTAVTASFVGDASYAASNGTGPLTVTSKQVTVTPDSGQSKVFGAGDPVLSFTLSEVIATTGALARTAGTDVGTYAINLGTLAATSSNYSLVLSATPVTFAITAKPVTVTPNSGQTKVFG